MLDDPSVAAGEVAGLPATIGVDGTQVAVWPDGQGESVVGAARIARTHFADFAAYHRQLTEAAFAAREDPSFHRTLPTLARAGCGDKVRAIAQWDAPAAALIHARALMFAHRVTGRGGVYVDDAWGSIHGAGDYCLPHSHVRALVSIVYMLDPRRLRPGRPARRPPHVRRSAHRPLLSARARTGHASAGSRHAGRYDDGVRRRIRPLRERLSRNAAANHAVVEHYARAPGAGGGFADFAGIAIVSTAKPLIGPRCHG